MGHHHQCVFNYERDSEPICGATQPRRQPTSPLLVGCAITAFIKTPGNQRMPRPLRLNIVTPFPLTDWGFGQLQAAVGSCIEGPPARATTSSNGVFHRRRILIATLVSEWLSKPHIKQEKATWFLRLPVSAAPQAEHVCDVQAGFTVARYPPRPADCQERGLMWKSHSPCHNPTGHRSGRHNTPPDLQSEPQRSIPQNASPRLLRAWI
jgi:hypothetical protein